ncbi:Eukaryotic peptide chain release factor GTP-binding subunit ERF3A [Zea mays]|uniref:Eukaryotic peptide chain release factor GTP-binding subunit ERF3A n=1 Tax=Zea mays TaxID=4577 RepID=A0A3L6G6J2_MAIZE|nr:Eukaryotic peptide chain release factor GTP-binding subunit ERF3A [Zea mays]
MEHDAHAEASSHAVPLPEDATVDDWARDDAEPMSVESSATPPEVAAVDSGADTPPAPSPSPSAAVAGEGVKEIQSSLQSLELKTNGTLIQPYFSIGVVATQEDAHVVEDDVEETKRHLNVVFIGHVDAGKSTTGGQILFLSGQVDDRTIQKYEKEAKDKSRESWERLLKLVGPTLRQNTQDSLSWMHRYLFLLFVAYVTNAGLRHGHKSYVPNMISGASQADIGVLVISARKGEFETGYERGGQTREHVLLAKTLGVAKLVVVINKMDEPTVKWSKERYDEIEAKMVPFLKSSGYNVKKDVQFLPISGLVGTNMKTRMDKSICSWWDGPCLFEVLDRIVVPLRDPKGSVRMPIIDKYKDMGTVVMGKIESGTIREGDSLLVMPNKSHVKVIGLNLDESKVRRAGPAENVRVKLSGVEEEDVMAGFVLSSVANPVGAVSEFIAQLQILELLDNAIFTAGYKAVLHIHSVVEECEIVELIEEIGMKKKKEDPKKKKPKRKPLFVKNGAIVVCRIQVNNLICIEKFSDFPQLGRFTLRTEGKTVAVGKVVDIPPAGSPTF